MIVTKKSLQDMLAYEADEERLKQIIGRALVALFRRQTEVEKAVNTTKTVNNRGFTAADAKSGSITAKYFIKHGTLLDWQVRKWAAGMGEFGEPRLVKYWRQLNEVAEEKRAAKAA